MLGRYKNVNLKNLKEGIENLESNTGDDSFKPRDTLNSVLNFEIERSSEDYYLAFKHLCDRFHARRRYISWLRYTGFSHPTYASACAYLSSNGDNTELVRQPTHVDADSTQGMMGSLLLATYAMNRLVQGQPWDAILAKIEARLTEDTGFQNDSM